MRDLNELGMRPPRSIGEFRPPTEEDVRAFEQRFDVRLPADYVAFLKQFNGGDPTAGWFDTPSGYLGCIGSFHYLLPEDARRLNPRMPDAWEFGNLWAETRELRKTILRLRDELPDIRAGSTAEILPFGYDNGNSSVFAFDLRSDPPTVCMIVVSEGFRVVTLADSFTQFVGRLYEHPEFRRPTRPRPKRIRLVPHDGAPSFPHDAVLALLRRLPGADVSPAIINTSEERRQPSGMLVRFSKETVRALERAAASGKCFDFSWDGPPALRGNLFEGELYLRVVDDEAGTVKLATAWAEELGLRIIVR